MGGKTKILVTEEEAHRYLCLCTLQKGRTVLTHAAGWGWQVRASGLSWTISGILLLLFSTYLEVIVPSSRCVHTQATASDNHTDHLKQSK